MSLAEAQGYCDLQLYEDAWLVLQYLAPEQRDFREALGLRPNILAATAR